MGAVKPCMKGDYAFANLRTLMPEVLNETLIHGIEAFGHIIPGFSRGDMVLSGIESRTSSPVRICRNEAFSPLYPGFIPVERAQAMQEALHLLPWTD